MGTVDSIVFDRLNAELETNIAESFGNVSKGTYMFRCEYYRYIRVSLRP